MIPSWQAIGMRIGQHAPAIVGMENLRYDLLLFLNASTMGAYIVGWLM
jgi:hypothetical protein